MQEHVWQKSVTNTKIAIPLVGTVWTPPQVVKENPEDVGEVVAKPVK